MSLYSHEFLTLALVHFLAVVIPGPDFIITLRQSTLYGCRIGCITALGIGCGISVHVLYTLLGLGLILSQSALWMSIFQLIAALYLLYLAWGCLQGASSALEIELEDTSPSTMSMQKAFLTGFFTNALNPKATIFFLAIFTSIVSPTTPLGMQILYGGWMCLVNSLWFVLVSLIFTRVSIRSKFLKFHQVLEKMMGALFSVIALRLLLSMHF